MYILSVLSDVEWRYIRRHRCGDRAGPLVQLSTTTHMHRWSASSQQPATSREASSPHFICLATEGLGIAGEW